MKIGGLKSIKQIKTAYHHTIGEFELFPSMLRLQIIMLMKKGRIAQLIVDAIQMKPCFSNHSGFRAKRTNLSPFTKDFRAWEHSMSLRAISWAPLFEMGA